MTHLESKLTFNITCFNEGFVGSSANINFNQIIALCNCQILIIPHLLPNINAKIYNFKTKMLTKTIPKGMFCAYPR